MAAVHKSDFNFLETRRQFEEKTAPKPGGGGGGGGLRSFIHKRNNSDGSNLSPSLSPAFRSAPDSPGGQQDSNLRSRRPVTMAFPKLSIDTQALGQIRQNGSVDSPRSPTKALRDALRDPPSSAPDGQKSPSKNSLATLSAKFSKDKAKNNRESKDFSYKQPSKTRSSTNLTGLLSRPRSNKNLGAQASDQESLQGKNKENRKPSDPVDNPNTPIYAQFCRSSFGGAVSVPSSPYGQAADPFTQTSLLNLNNSFRPVASDHRPGLKQRPRSFQPQYSPQPEPAQMDDKKENRGRLKPDEANDRLRSTTHHGKSRSISRARMLSAISTIAGKKSKSPSPPPESNESVIDPNDIDKHLEAMLDRRNIPENQRYKMRNLNSTIKMEFIRQDWAENEAKRLVRPPTNESDGSAADSSKDSVRDPNDKKHPRGRSFTLSRNSWKIGGSPSKKKKDAFVNGHSRNKSVDSVVNDRPTSSSGTYATNAFIAKVTGQQPGDFVNYLRKVQKPEAVEVGKLHKLRLLLRNERVAWTEDFIQQGGMKEIVGLLHRIMEVEWREEHEDALLHEDLLCLKALCTTALALQYLHEISNTLFPALIHMIFDPEKKGPSEFTTRNIITSVLLTYIQSGTPQERLGRAQSVLKYLRDPDPKEEERPVDFVLEMRRERPYRVWNKEVVSVTKEVFWIFLHHLNVIALPAGRDRSTEDIRKTANTKGPRPHVSDQGLRTSAADEPFAYMNRHFPQERPPVPAAPYVGGVEWDATNYLASHLDLMNAILACTPTQAERNALREQFRISGWERCMGSSMRLCKEKFYPGVHDALRVWVAAAADDGWDVRDVRFGPPPESRSTSPKKTAAGAAGAKKKKAAEEPPPRLEMPKLDFVMDGPLSAVP